MWFTYTNAGERPTHINKSKIKIETSSRLSEKGRAGRNGLNFVLCLVFVFKFLSAIINLRWQRLSRTQDQGWIILEVVACGIGAHIARGRH